LTSVVFSRMLSWQTIERKHSSLKSFIKSFFFFLSEMRVHSGLPSIAGLLPDGVGVPATTYDYLRPSQFAYTSLILKP
jgi:hypothetical protein